MDIACVGLIVCDIIIKPLNESVFKADSTRLDTLKIASGGDALNAAINMAKLGMHVGLIGKVGRDALGEYLIGKAEQYGINVSKVQKALDCSTSTSIVMVEESGERHFAYYGVANDTLSISDTDLDFLKKAKILHVGSAMALEQLDGPGLVALFQKAKSFGMKTSLDVTWDSSGRWLQKIEDALYYTDIFMPNYAEARRISSCDTVQQMRSFFSRYGLEIFVVKLGRDGCYITDFKEEHLIETFQHVQVVDTTGAGDAFVSGFLTGMIKGWDLLKCGVFGNATAARCVMEIGATAGIDSMDGVLGFIRSSPNDQWGYLFSDV